MTEPKPLHVVPVPAWWFWTSTTYLILNGIISAIDLINR
jgi:hypothetical protein